MLISTRGRYALRVLIDLAEHAEDGLIPMKVVAERQQISLKYLEQILPILSKNGIVEAVHGKGGGYRLLVDPNTCTAYDILTLTEGDLAAISCLEAGAKPCPRVEACKTISMWRGLDKVVKDYLRGVKIADFL